MPPAVNHNTNNAAVQAAAKAEREEKLRGALKQFILQERQKKKEEFDAKLEEERLRQERDERERENNVTLDDTKGQITKLEQKLGDLRNQKMQLVLQLKKVLNEDETRRKQQKDNEMFAIQALQAQQASIPQPQVFLPPVRLQHHPMPVLPKPVANQPTKRGRSPSPPQQQYYKTTNYNQSKHDDRRGQEYPRVLWNKPINQYSHPALFYQAPNTAPPPQSTPDARGASIIYPNYNIPLRQAYHMELQPTSSVPVSKSDSTAQKFSQVYHINLDQPPISQAGTVSTGPGGSQSQKPQVTMEKIPDRFHVELKHEPPPGHGPPPPHGLPDGVVYTSLIPALPLHATNVMQISGSPSQNPKTGPSLTQNYGPRGAVNAHEQQMVRQQQLSVIPGQPVQQPPPPQQQYNYTRHIY